MPKTCRHCDQALSEQYLALAAGISVCKRCATERDLVNPSTLTKSNAEGSKQSRELKQQKEQRAGSGLKSRQNLSVAHGDLVSDEGSQGEKLNHLETKRLLRLLLVERKQIKSRLKEAVEQQQELEEVVRNMWQEKIALTQELDALRKYSTELRITLAAQRNAALEEESSFAGHAKPRNAVQQSGERDITQIWDRHENRTVQEQVHNNHASTHTLLNTKRVTEWADKASQPTHSVSFNAQSTKTNAMHGIKSNELDKQRHSRAFVNGGRSKK